MDAPLINRWRDLIFILAFGKNSCGHQFLNWWQQQSTGLLHLTGSNPDQYQKEGHPLGGLLFGGDGGI